MQTWYELWDSESANLVGTFDSEEQALAVVKHSVVSFGPESIRSLVLTSENDQDPDAQVIGSGDDLIRRAKAGKVQSI